MSSIKPSVGICRECYNQCVALGVDAIEKRLAVKKPIPLCVYHNTKKNIAKKFTKSVMDSIKKGSDFPPAKTQKVKKVARKRKPTGEAVVFKEIWEEREHTCVSCLANLGNEARAHYFSHIIKKGSNNSLRLDKNNIVLECMDCHTNWDFGTLEEKKKQLSFKSKMKYIKANAPALYQMLNLK
jgi:hypothetical protein